MNIDVNIHGQHFFLPIFEVTICFYGLTLHIKIVFKQYHLFSPIHIQNFTYTQTLLHGHIDLYREHWFWCVNKRTCSRVYCLYTKRIEESFNNLTFTWYFMYLLVICGIFVSIGVFDC